MGGIRSELKRFERRRLRPLFRFLRFGRHDPRGPALVADASRAGGSPMPEMEELLVAMIRADMRRAPAHKAAATPYAPTGSATLDAFVRAMLAAPPTGEGESGRRGAA